MAIQYQFAFFLCLVAVPCVSYAQTPAAISDVDAPIRVEGDPIDAAQFLETLRQRDAQFDNLTLTVEKSWVDRVEPQRLLNDEVFHALKSGVPWESKDFEKVGKIPPPYDQPHQVTFEMTVRDPEVTVAYGKDFIKAVNPQWMKTDTGELRWSTHRGVEKSFHAHPGDGSSKQHVPQVFGSDSQLEMMRNYIQFSCGYGYGRRMLSADKCVQRGDTRVLQGTLRFGFDDEQECRLEVDGDWIVRRAQCVLHKNGGVVKLNIVTLGMSRPANLPAVAASGVVIRKLTQPPIGDQVPIENTVLNDSYRFLSTRVGLTDAEYLEIVRIAPKPDTLIDDGSHYAPLATVMPAPVAQSQWLWMTLLLNALVVPLAVVIGRLWQMNRQRTGI